MIHIETYANCPHCKQHVFYHCETEEQIHACRWYEETRKAHTMTREQAIRYIGYCIDDALSIRSVEEMPANARLVGWQCGFEPMFVAVWSYIEGVRLDDLDAEEIAISLLEDKNWFAGSATEPDYVL